MMPPMIDPREAQRQAILQMLAQGQQAAPAPPQAAISPLGDNAMPGPVPPPGSAPRAFPLPSAMPRGRGPC